MNHTRSSHKLLMLIMALSLAVTGLATALTPALAQAAQVNMILSPSAATVNLGSTFTVNIAIQPQGGQTVNGADAFVHFDPAVLQVVDADAVTAGVQVAPAALTRFPMELINTADNTTGDISYSAGTVGAPVSTSFNMATITFSTLAASAGTNITFVQTPPLSNTDAALDGVSVLGALTNTTIVVVVPAAPPVNMTLTPSAYELTVGQTFTVNVNVLPTGGLSADAVDGFVDFDPAVLQVVSIAKGVNNTLPIENVSAFDNTAGTADYSSATLAPPGPTTNFILDTITFQTIAASASTNLTFSTVFGRTTQVARAGGDVTGSLTGVTLAVIEPPVNLSLVASTGSVAAGQSFTVNINVSTTGGLGVDGVDAFVDFNPSELQVVDSDAVTAGVQIAEGAGNLLPQVMNNTADNALGQIGFSGLKNPALPSPTGSFTMATITFQAVGVSTPASITFSAVFGRNTDAVRGGGSVLGTLTLPTVNVTVGPLHHITITPANPSVGVAANQTYTATTYDQYNNARVGDPITWSVTNATAGSINSGTGVFTAGTATGAYANVVRAASGAVNSTASVTITSGALHHITVSPSNASVVVQGNQTYTATAYDQYNNPRTGDAITWSVSNPAAGVINANTGVYTAGTVAAAYNNVIVATSGAITGNASSTVTPGALSAVTVSPANPNVAAGGAQTYTAATFDAFGNPRTGDPIVWSVTNAAAGAINAGTGVLTAATVPGAFANVVVATSGAVTGNASVTIVPAAVHHITVTPAAQTLAIAGAQTFTAATFDQYNNARAGDVIVWSVTDPAFGAINAGTGAFTAGTLAGLHTGAVVATVGAVTGTANVTINPDPLHHIIVSPSQPNVVRGRDYPFMATTYDQYDNARTGDPIVWSIAPASVAAGTINAATGVFTASQTNGTYTNAIVATSGAFTGTASVRVYQSVPPTSTPVPPTAAPTPTATTVAPTSTPPPTETPVATVTPEPTAMATAAPTVRPPVPTALPTNAAEVSISPLGKSIQVTTDNIQVSVNVPTGAIGTGGSFVAIHRDTTNDDTARTVTIKTEGGNVVGQLPAGYRAGDTALNLELSDSTGKPIATLSKSVTVTVGVSAADLARAGGNINRLTIGYIDAAGLLNLIPNRYVKDNSLTFETNHLSLWVVVVSDTPLQQVLPQTGDDTTLVLPLLLGAAILLLAVGVITRRRFMQSK